MEFNFDISRVFQSSQSGIACIDSSTQNHYNSDMNQIINCLGSASSRAQGLNTTITSSDASSPPLINGFTLRTTKTSSGLHESGQKAPVLHMSIWKDI